MKLVICVNPSGCVYAEKYTQNEYSKLMRYKHDDDVIVYEVSSSQTKIAGQLSDHAHPTKMVCFAFDLKD